MLSNFFEGTTKKFTVTITYNGQVQDISADTVTLFLKRSRAEPDAEAALVTTADVVTNGVDGQADFVLTPAETAIAPREYYYEMLWELSTGEEFVLEHGQVEVLDRLADV